MLRIFSVQSPRSARQKAQPQGRVKLRCIHLVTPAKPQSGAEPGAGCAATELEVV